MGKLTDGAKNAAKNVAKNKIKKLIKGIAIKYILPLMGIICLCVIVVSAVLVCFQTVADRMESAINTLGQVSTNFWKWITNDYWIDVMQKYTLTDKEGNAVLDDDGNEVEGTMVDQYYYKIVNEMGLSLKELGMLNTDEIDFTQDEEKGIIKNEETRKQVYKYIKAFLNADLISSQIHKNRTAKLTNPSVGNPDTDIDADEVDGCIYLFRTVDKAEDADTSDEKKIDTAKRMHYLEYGSEDQVDSFLNKIKLYNDLNNPGAVVTDAIQSYFSIDENNQLVIAQIEEVKTSIEYSDSKIEPDVDTATTKKATVITIDYKEAIEKYLMPYTFLVELCNVSENPEFVFRVAQMCLNSKIILLVEENTTIVTETTADDGTLENRTYDSSDAQTGTSSKSANRKVTTTTTTTNPVVEATYVNSWDYFVTSDVIDHITVTTEEDVTSGLSDATKREDQYNNYDGRSEYLGHTEDQFIDYTRTHNTKTVTHEYEAQKKQDVLKSDNFLGLLQNSTGTYMNGTTPYFEIDGCKYDKDGEFVSYQVPSTDSYRTPISTLISGKEMLCTLLDGTLSSATISDDNDKEVSTMGLSDVIRQLLEFPEQEPYDLSDGDVYDLTDEDIYDLDEDIIEDNNNETIDSSYIVKTDETGALPEVTENDLITMINGNSGLTSTMKSAALTATSKFIEVQSTYKVNPVFLLSVAQIETHFGVNASSKSKNNWYNWYPYNGGFYPYDTTEDCIEAVASGLANGSGSTQYFTIGRITIASIGKVYCPDIPAYPTQAENWIDQVTSTVKYYYSLIGKDITGASSGSGSSGGNSSGGQEIQSSGKGYYSTYTSAITGKTYKNYKQAYYYYTNGDTSAFSMWSWHSGCGLNSASIILSAYSNKYTPAYLYYNYRVPDGQVNITKYLNLEGLSYSIGYDKGDMIDGLSAGSTAIVCLNPNVKVPHTGITAGSSGHYITFLDIRCNDEAYEVYVSNPGNRNADHNGWVNINYFDGLIAGYHTYIISNK